MFSDYVLENNVIASYQVTSQVDCGSKCLRDTRCLSFNYKITNSNMDECEINKANKSTCPGCYHAQKKSIYYDDEVTLCQESLYEFLVSKETVVLLRWERSKQKFSFIKRVDKG